MAKKKLKETQLFINRELSWLAFNQRVLDEGVREDLPLLERVKFLAITSSNLDEFFMIRVGGLRQLRKANVRKRDITGMSPSQQLDAIAKRTHQMVDDQAKAIGEATALLSKQGLHLLERSDWSADQQKFLRQQFIDEILPTLTPLSVQDIKPSPLIPAMQLNLAVHLSHAEKPEQTTIIVIPVPTCFPRFLTIPAEKEVYIARLEDVIAENIGQVFPNAKVKSTCPFRITRDGDVTIDEDETGDLLNAVDKMVIDRRTSSVVRLEIPKSISRSIRKFLVNRWDIRANEIYTIDGMLDAKSLFQIAGRAGFDELKIPHWPAQPPRDLVGSEDIFQTLQKQDALLIHPYESFGPVVDLIDKAADDPNVLAIKQTLYRTSGDSPIVSALERAAQNGKQVTVLVELKARFDEARNVTWAKRLEDAGCHVIYGIVGYKTHAKALLIVRREQSVIRRYAHMATGNYNDQTASIYSDIGLMTSDRDLTADVAAFFNLLTGYSEVVGWSQLSIAPTNIRSKTIELIEREANASTPQQPGLIMVKVNSLNDKGIIQALYRASQAGVKVMLNIRGICCLKPGIKGVSENIEVRSIIDRYLEHARIFYFHNGGKEEVYLSSADWMGRNLDKRLETMFPVRDKKLKRRLIRLTEMYFSDNMQSSRLLSDGTYEKVVNDEPKFRVQQKLYKQAVNAAKKAKRGPTRFKPITKPE